MFGGDIAAFLEQAGFGTFGGIRRLLDGQVDRLSLLEQQILAWLGLEREPATFGQLVADLGSRSGRGELLEAVEALRRRSLIDRAQRGARSNAITTEQDAEKGPDARREEASAEA